MRRVLFVAVALAGILLLPKSVHRPGHDRRGHPRRVRRGSSGRDRRGVQSVLIEKTRTVVSDGTGQYRITDLPPGTLRPDVLADRLQPP